MGRLDEPWVVDNPPSRRYPIYTRGNVGEVFPDPVTPLTWTIGGRPGGEPGWRDALVRFGAFDEDEFDPDEIEVLGVFGGYCYLNVSISRILGARVPGLTPEQIDFSIFGEQPGVPPYQAAPTDDRPDLTAKSGGTLQWILTADGLPELVEEQQFVERLRAERPDLGSLDDADLVARARELFGTHFRRQFGQHLFITYAATVPVGIIHGASAALGDPTLAMCLVAGLGGVDSAAPSWALWDLGRMVAGSAALTAAFEAGPDRLPDRLRALGGDGVRFFAAFDRFLYDFGSRGPNEWEMRSPTWETDPGLALTAIDRMRRAPDDESPDASNAAVAGERERLGASLLEQLAGDAAAAAQVGAALRAAAIFLPGRERSKTTIIRLVHESRMAMRELGRRLVERGQFDDAGDFAFLRLEELDELLADPSSVAGRIAERKAWYAELAEREPPFLVVGEPTTPATWPRRHEAPVEVARTGDVLTGIPGCPGSATGRARVLQDPGDPTVLEPGDVLVAPITDPSWTPLFVPAAAVVVDVGAQLSHAVIVSRELGIPCVVSVTDATRRIADGTFVSVDGTTGIVTVVEAPVLAR
jgi:phosphohistidine swiveling domain-containing protein